MYACLPAFLPYLASSQAPHNTAPSLTFTASTQRFAIHGARVKNDPLHSSSPSFIMFSNPPMLCSLAFLLPLSPSACRLQPDSEGLRHPGKNHLLGRSLMFHLKGKHRSQPVILDLLFTFCQDEGRSHGKSVDITRLISKLSHDQRRDMELVY
ncbi:hypothetical protein E2C01_036744 [Portunus trituberculatus]|uniref:Uncharacterized protein n=1 Tax=Portunus trituberculatus TaxID=210409 RepID=A0A5B7FC21_PORTR|nr:hypothetical protein [Portunus trituberculatus]